MLAMPVFLDKKLVYDFAQEMCFDVKAMGKKSTRDRTLLWLHQSHAIMAYGISTILLSSGPNELCDRQKLLKQQKQAGKFLI